jgi:hypothetical protein
MYLTPEQVDARLLWPPGRAERLARQRRLPHVLLPDGRIRFIWEQLERHITYVPSVIAPPRSDETSSEGGHTDE